MIISISIFVSFQFCGNYGSSVFTWSLEMCLAYDSGNLICLHTNCSPCSFPLGLNFISPAFYPVGCFYCWSVSTNQFACLQNDLVHGWGLDFALRRCVDVSDSTALPHPRQRVKTCGNTLCCNFVITSLAILQPAHEKIGVVDSQWIVHQVIPSLGSQVRKQ